MTLRQIIVPWIQGYDIGVGADLASGSPMNMVVDGTATSPQDATGAGVDFQVKRIQTTSDLEEVLGVDADASYGCAAFGAGISGRFSFAHDSKVQSSSLFMVVTALVTLSATSVDHPVMTDPAQKVADDGDVFTERYGNMFVRGMSTGGLFVGVLQVDTGSSTESETISAELEGSYGLFSADAKAKFSDVEAKYRSNVSVRMFHQGGPTDLAITDPTDPRQLLDNCNTFLDSLAKTPSLAKPYTVSLAPIAIAEGPLPPNPVDVEHGQDVIVFCAKRRSAMLDQLNLVQFILDHEDTYDFTQSAGVDSCRQAVVGLQSDLDLVAACASAAMNDPKSAVYPADFAKAEGQAFPVGTMPSPLPVQKVRAAPDGPTWTQRVTPGLPKFSAIASLRGADASAPTMEAMLVATDGTVWKMDDAAGGVITELPAPAGVVGVSGPYSPVIVDRSGVIWTGSTLDNLAVRAAPDRPFPGAGGSRLVFAHARGALIYFACTDSGQLWWQHDILMGHDSQWDQLTTPTPVRQVFYSRDTGQAWALPTTPDAGVLWGGPESWKSSGPFGCTDIDLDVAGSTLWMLGENGTVWTTQGDPDQRVQQPGSGFVAIAGGFRDHLAMGLQADGTVWDLRKPL